MRATLDGPKFRLCPSVAILCHMTELDRTVKLTVMKTRLIMLLAVAIFGSMAARAQSFRPPSVPLVTFDPYLSIWSAADRLTDRPTQHWTAKRQSLISLIRVDGSPYRLMGDEPATAPALPQTGLQVTPTRSIYDFENDKVHVTLTFMRPALPDDLDAFSLPLSYITWQVRSVDGGQHAVSIYDSTSSQLVMNTNVEKVAWSREKDGDLTALRVGTTEQHVLGSSGDDHRINWGYVYAAASSSEAKAAIGADAALIRSFVSNGSLPLADDKRMPRAVKDEQPVLAFVFDLGEITSTPITRNVIVAYDEIYAIKYFGKPLLPYWRRDGVTTGQMLQKAMRDYSRLARRCEEFDQQLTSDATKAGGAKYAQMCALAYRQCACACGLAADANKQPLFFTKENTSNGDIATVDVFFPMDPQWVLLSPALAKATLVPILAYAASWHWKFPNAPHDLGTYPIAKGTDDGGEGMPVEESGNMLILCDSVSQLDGNTHFVDPWWPQLTQWAVYLEKYGLDPEDQLRRPPGPQRQSFRQSHSRPGVLRGFVPAARRRRRCGAISSNRQGGRRALDEGRGRRRSFPPRFRQAGNLEPEVQPRLGPHSWIEYFSAGSGQKGSRALQENAATVRRPAGFTH